MSDPRERQLEAAIEAGWKEFERITYSDRPKHQGGYTPSRGAFEFSFRTGASGLLAECARLREALIQHREDLHQFSTRPCETCRKSAEALGIARYVPNQCAKADTDRAAFERARGALAGAPQH